MKAEIYYFNRDAFDNYEYLRAFGIFLLRDIKTNHIPKYLFKRYWTKVSDFDSEVHDSLDDIYVHFNMGVNLLATRKGQELLMTRKVGHTSMSIGDIIKVKSSYYIVDTIGFAKIVLR